VTSCEPETPGASCRQEVRPFLGAGVMSGQALPARVTVLNPEAYNLFLRARAAIDAALKLDPNLAELHSLRAQRHGEVRGLARLDGGRQRKRE